MKKTFILLPLLLLLAACANTPQQASPTITPKPQDLTEIFDMKWVFHHAIVNGVWAMDYQDALGGQKIWMTLMVPEFDDNADCQSFFDNQEIPFYGRCFVGYDGCNPMIGVYSATEGGEFLVHALDTTLSGCSISEISFVDEQTQATRVVSTAIVSYDSEPFQDALSKSVSFKVDGDELRVYYPASGENYLIFLRETE